MTYEQSKEEFLKLHPKHKIRKCAMQGCKEDEITTSLAYRKGKYYCPKHRWY